jgi:hypothetical protein
MYEQADFKPVVQASRKGRGGPQMLGLVFKANFQQWNVLELLAGAGSSGCAVGGLVCTLLPCWFQILYFCYIKHTPDFNTPDFAYSVFMCWLFVPLEALEGDTLRRWGVGYFLLYSSSFFSEYLTPLYTTTCSACACQCAVTKTGLETHFITLFLCKHSHSWHPSPVQSHSLLTPAEASDAGVRGRNSCDKNRSSAREAVRQRLASVRLGFV